MNTDDASPPPLASPDSPVRGDPPFRPSAKMWRLSLLLFCLTFVSMFYTGAAFHSGIRSRDLEAALWEASPQRPQILRRALWSGLSYAGPLMGILLLHEFGHYLQARRYGVPAIPPMFIPMPFSPFGTMGAIIVQSPHHADRKAMFDIAISGPLAGLCLALPVAWFGIQQSQVITYDETAATPFLGDPLVLKWMIRAVHGPLASNQDVLINPLLMAGWVGVFITALNLAPVGQLDGGHILYCLIGKRAHVVAVVFVWLIVAYMVLTQYWAFSVMIVLMVMMGLKHPPTTNDRVPLGAVRTLLGWLTLAFLLIGINPRPIDVGPAPAQQEPQLQQPADPAEPL